MERLHKSNAEKRFAFSWRRKSLRAPPVAPVAPVERAFLTSSLPSPVAFNKETNFKNPMQRNLQRQDEIVKEGRT